MGSAATIDQRGLSRDAAPDLGGTELQPVADLPLIWLVDADGDGTGFGLERGFGTDNTIPDAGDPANPRVTGDGAGVTFEFDPTVATDTAWIVEYSVDLGEFNEVYRFAGGSDSVDPSFTFDRTGNRITVSPTSPAQRRGFLRVVTEFLARR